jgi:hypothetical protein
MVFRLLLLCFILGVIELYAFQAFKTVFRLRWALTLYQIISLLLFAFIVYSFTQFDRSVGQTRQTLLTMGLLLLVYIPKIVATLILFGEDIYRVVLERRVILSNPTRRGIFFRAGESSSARLHWVWRPSRFCH